MRRIPTSSTMRHFSAVRSAVVPRAAFVRAGLCAQVRLYSQSNTATSADDKAAAIERLRTALASERNTLHPHIAQTLDDVIAGRVPVLSRADAFNFKCTMCGNCCRRFGPSLFLTPHDIFLMSRSPTAKGAGAVTTVQFLKRFSAAFEIAPEDARGIPSMRMVAANAREPRRSDGAASDSAKETHATVPRCPFSAGVVRRKDGPGSPLVRQLNAEGNEALACVLGPEHMPAKCASFPLSRGTDAAQGLYFPVQECEGYSQHLPSSPSQTVGSYVESRGLEQRWSESDWFRTLRESTRERLRGETAAAKGFDAIADRVGAGSAAMLVCEVLSVAWFNFDTLRPQGTNRDAAHDGWEEAKASIARETDRAVEAVATVGERVKAVAGTDGAKGDRITAGAVRGMIAESVGWLQRGTPA